MSSPWMRKHATGTGADIIIPMIKSGASDFAVGADWTPAAGDVKISKDGGAAANIATLPVFVTDIGWKFVFSDAELTAARININVVDSATKAVEDQHLIIETYGNASAQHAFDLNTAIQSVNVVGHTPQTGDNFARLGAPAGASVSADVAAVQSDTDDIQTRIPSALVGGRIDANVGAVSGDVTAADNLELDYDGTGLDKSNSTIGNLTTLSAAAVDAIWDELITANSARKLMRLLEASQGGKVNGVGSGTVNVRDAADTKNVISANTDGIGNRTSVSLLLT